MGAVTEIPGSMGIYTSEYMPQYGYYTSEYIYVPLKYGYFCTQVSVMSLIIDTLL